MAQQTFELTGAVATAGTLSWAGAILMDEGLLATPGAAYLRVVTWDAGNFAIRLETAIDVGGGTLAAGPDLTAEIEQGTDFHFAAVGGASIDVAGPDNDTNLIRDTGEPYFWQPADPTAFNTWVAGLAAGATIQLRVGPTPPPAGLETTDFAVPEGTEALVLATLEATVEGVNITVDPVSPVMGEVTVAEASDPNGALVIGQVERHDSGQTIRLRRTTSSVDMSTYFDDEGSPVYPAAKLYIQTAKAGPAVPFTIGNTGGGFNNWTIDDTGQASVITAIATGTRFLLAITTPATSVEVSATVSGGGEVAATVGLAAVVSLAGVIGGGGEVSAALTAAGVSSIVATLDGGGEVVAVVEITGEVSLSASIDGGGEVAATVGLTDVSSLVATIDGGGEVVGIVSATQPPAVTSGLRVEIDGQDVSDYPGVSASVDQEVGQRSTARVQIALVEGAELPGGGVPADFDRVRIEHPGQPYRSVALGLDPWLYWPLDDGPGQASADDISGNDRPGTWSTGAADVTRRAIVAETAPVPYGAAPWIGDANPAIESDDDTSAIGVDVTVALFVRIDTAAAGTQNILNTRSGSAGLRLRRVRIDAATQRLEWLVGSQTVTRTVSAGRWLLVIARRSATLMSLRVDAAETDMVTAAQTSTAGTSQQLALAGGALRSHVDELAVWDSVLTDSQVDALVAARDSWRAFGGVIYGRQYAPQPGVGPSDETTDQWTLPCVDGSLRIDLSDLTGIFASVNATAAGVLAREMLSQIDPPWAGTTYGADLGTLINRIVARGGAGSTAIDLLARLAEAIDVVDAWEDFGLIRAGTTHLIDDTLTEDDFVRGWTPRWIVEHFRTRTIARGGGISGGVTFFEFTGDGSTVSWALPYPVREVVTLTVDGTLQTFGSGEWQIVDKIELRAPSAPSSGAAGKLEFDIEAPLIAIAEDAVTAAAIGGHIVRSVEDSSIDSLETLEELARTTQARHGAIGFEVAGDLIPLKRPRFLGVGGSPRVEVRGYTGRMTLQRLRSTWLGGGAYVQQHVTLRVNDLASGLDYQRRRQVLALPTLPERPVLPLPHAGITVGQKLPHTLGGAWNYFLSSTTWVPIGGHVEYTIDWNIYDGFVLAISFMAILDVGAGTTVGTETARVRLRDITRAVTLGQEEIISGVDAQPYVIPDVIAPAGAIQSKLRLECRRVDADVAVYGAEIDVA